MSSKKNRHSPRPCSHDFDQTGAPKRQVQVLPFSSNTKLLCRSIVENAASNAQSCHIYTIQHTSTKRASVDADGSASIELSEALTSGSDLTMTSGFSYTLADGDNVLDLSDAGEFTIATQGSGANTITLGTAGNTIKLGSSGVDTVVLNGSASSTISGLGSNDVLDLSAIGGGAKAFYNADERDGNAVVLSEGGVYSLTYAGEVKALGSDAVNDLFGNDSDSTFVLKSVGTVFVSLVGSDGTAVYSVDTTGNAASATKVAFIDGQKTALTASQMNTSAETLETATVPALKVVEEGSEDSNIALSDDRTQITLTFNTALSSADADQFTVTVGGSEVSLAEESGAVASGDTVTLTLTEALAQGVTAIVTLAGGAVTSSDGLINGVDETGAKISVDIATTDEYTVSVAENVATVVGSTDKAVEFSYDETNGWSYTVDGEKASLGEEVKATEWEGVDLSGAQAASFTFNGLNGLTSIVANDLQVTTVKLGDGDVVSSVDVSGVTGSDKIVFDASGMSDKSVEVTVAQANTEGGITVEGATTIVVALGKDEGNLATSLKDFTAADWAKDATFDASGVTDQAVTASIDQLSDLTVVEAKTASVALAEEEENAGYDLSTVTVPETWTYTEGEESKATAFTFDAKDVKGDVKVKASQLTGDNALTISGATSLTVVANGAWAPKSLPEGVETLTIVGTGSVDFSNLAATTSLSTINLGDGHSVSLANIPSKDTPIKVVGSLSDETSVSGSFQVLPTENSESTLTVADGSISYAVTGEEGSETKTFAFSGVTAAGDSESATSTVSGSSDALNSDAGTIFDLTGLSGKIKAGDGSVAIDFAQSDNDVAQVVKLDATSYLSANNDGDYYVSESYTISAGSNDLVVLDNSSTISDFIPTEAFPYTLNLGSGDTQFIPYLSDASRNATLRSEMMDKDTGAWVIGGEGADFLEYAHVMIAGDYTYDQLVAAKAGTWAESTSSSLTVSNANALYALCRGTGTVDSSTVHNQAIVDSAFSAFENANVLFGSLNLMQDSVPDDAPEIEVVCSEAKDTLYLMYGVETQGEVGSLTTFGTTPAKSVTIHSFGKEDNIVIADQFGKYMAPSSTGNTSVTATAMIKFDENALSSSTVEGTYTAPADSTSGSGTVVAKIALSDTNKVLNLSSDGKTLILNWSKIDDALTDLNTSITSETTPQYASDSDTYKAVAKAATSWGKITESNITTDFVFDTPEVTLGNAYLEIEVTGTFAKTDKGLVGDGITLDANTWMNWADATIA